MENETLVKRLACLGLPLFQTDEYLLDVNEVLAETVKSNNVRLWESFPLLLANSNKRGEFNYKEVVSLFKSYSDVKGFQYLFLLSLAFYKYLHLKFRWAETAYKNLVDSEKDLGNHFLHDFKENHEVKVSGRKLSLQRMEQLFDNYYKKEEEDLNKLQEKKANLSLEYALSQLFTPKEKELFLKKFKREKLTKTEREYFSRKVKKKVLALTNSELNHLAQELLNR